MTTIGIILGLVISFAGGLVKGYLKDQAEQARARRARIKVVESDLVRQHNARARLARQYGIR